MLNTGSGTRKNPYTQLPQGGLIWDVKEPVFFMGVFHTSRTFRYLERQLKNGMAPTASEVESHLDLLHQEKEQTYNEKFPYDEYLYHPMTWHVNLREIVCALQKGNMDLVLITMEEPDDLIIPLFHDKKGGVFNNTLSDAVYHFSDKPRLFSVHYDNGYVGFDVYD